MDRALRDFLDNHGFKDIDPILDGTIHRFTEGRKGKPCWYVGGRIDSHQGPIVWLTVGNWRLGTKYRFCSSGSLKTNPAAMKEYKQAMARLSATQRECQIATAEVAKKRWSHLDVCTGMHPYLTRKQLDGFYGARLDKRNCKIVVPTYAGPNGELVGLQTIDRSGIKRFTKGQRLAGTCFQIGKLDTVAIFTESYSTGVSLHMATGRPIVICFCASNLGTVIKSYLSRHPNLSVVIAADDDKWTETNPGKTYALKVHEQLGGIITLPRFRCLDARPTDFNDLHCLEGVEEVRSQLFPAIVKAGTLTIGSLKLEPYGSGQFAEDEPLPVVESFFYYGSISLLAARPKVGKSTFSQDVAYCVVRGQEFLKNYPCVKGKVFYLALEDHPRFLHEQLQTRGLNDSDMDYLLIHCGATDKNAVKDLKALLLKEKPDLLVVDHMALLLQLEDLNDYSTVNRKLAEVRDIARTTNTHILLLHHMNKKSDKGEGILGSTALRGAVDTTIILREDDGKRLIDVTQRYHQSFKLTLHLDERTRALTCSEREETDDSMTSDLLDVIRSNGEIDRAELLKKVRGQQQTKIDLLNRLVASEKIIKTGEGKRGDPVKFSINEDQPLLPN